MAADDEALAVINRAIVFGGQLASIGVEGLVETFLPEPPAFGRNETQPWEMTEPSDGTVIQ